MSQSWIWIATEVAAAAHLEQIAEHGGGEGVRDAGLLESAMARPRSLADYGKPDAAALAAAYAYGIARNHPFVDGNKRTAAVVSETFLALNGQTLAAADAQLMVAFRADLQIALELGAIELCRAGGAFDPETLRHGTAALLRADSGRHQFIEPAHRPTATLQTEMIARIKARTRLRPIRTAPDRRRLRA